MSNDETGLSRRTLKVFLAEDNQADVYLVEMALLEHGLQFQLTATLDGEEAIRRMEGFSEHDCPDIALLDQNLPRVNGQQVLEVIRRHQHCKQIPIVVMSSSGTGRDLEFFEKFDVTFFKKAANLDDFLKLGAVVKNLCFVGHDLRS